MKKSHVFRGAILFTGIFLGSTSLVVAQSTYSEPAKTTENSASNASQKTEKKPKYSKEDQDMIDFYSDPKNKAEIGRTANTLDKVKPLGDGFYLVTELALTYEDVRKKLDIFQAAYKTSQGMNERSTLLKGIITSYNSAAQQAQKAASQSANYSESDQKKINKYKEYYPKVLVILKDMLQKQN